MLDEKTRKKLEASQRSEITEHFIYRKLAEKTKEAHNKRILEGIAQDELRHYGVWKKYTGEAIKPDRIKIFKYFWISRIFGLTFGLRLMERGEERAQAFYAQLPDIVKDAERIEKDENEHENALLAMIDEEKLKYMSSIVLGLNDALVELTGALAGFTFVFQKTGTVALAGIVTGIAASLSMGASEYLSTKAEEGSKKPGKASVYTTVAYFLAVLFLIAPYLFIQNIYLSLGVTVLNAIILIVVFTFYISVARNMSFRKRFLEMASITLGIAALTFAIGFVVRMLFGIEI